MIVKRGADVVGNAGSSEWFSGRVWAEGLATDASGPTNVIRVSFEPGGRTAWHTHAQGQVLIVTSGRGLVQKRGEAPQPILPGDVVVIAGGEDHWHGAAADCPMQHLAVHHGGDVQWGEKVSDAEYRS